MTLIDQDDPFARPTDRRADIITAGRYRLPSRDGTPKKGGWQRVSNLVSAYSDQFALRMWEIEHTLRGIRGGHELYQELLDTDLDAMDKQERRRWVEAFCERCKQVSGGSAGADFGNKMHAHVEDHHAGLPLGVIERSTRRHLSLYASALNRHGLVAMDGMQERRVLVEQVEAIGTLDNVLERAGTADLVIGDLKTQRRFWTFLEIAAQLACYANATAMWDVARGCWVDMPPVSREVALVLWMPREHPSGTPAVDVYGVDIVAGWKTALHARQVVQDRSAAKSARNPRGWLLPAPGVTETERYAALLAAVDSMSEGSALVREIDRKGLWNPVLEDCARRAAERLTSTKN